MADIVLYPPARDQPLAAWFWRPPMRQQSGLAAVARISAAAHLAWCIEAGHDGARGWYFVAYGPPKFIDD